MATTPTGYDVVIAGAGFAGAATAAFLARRGVGRVLVAEAEPIPGRHGSGRNAAMARRVIEDPVLTALATESVAEMVALGARRGVPLLRRVGGLLLGREGAIDALAASAAAVPALAGEVHRLTRAEAAARVPYLAGATAEAALWSEGCGVADIHALLTALLDEAREGGARVRLSAPVEAVEVDGGRVHAVRLAGARVPCGAFVDAAGFSANRVAALAGLAPRPFDPVRRHLFVSAPWPGLDPAWPFAWDVSHGLYVRPEGAGLLMCACDQTSWPPEDPPTDPGEREHLAETFAAHLPALSEARPVRAWAGLRVMTPDGRFVVGPEPGLEGFVWAAGLGGHGMTTSCGVGRLAAAAVVDGALPAPYREAFAPDRFAAP